VLKRVAVLCSGGGTNLQAIIDAERQGVIKSGTVVLVVADRSDAYALERAEKAGIRTRTIVRKKGERQHFEQVLRQELLDSGIDLVVLAGFLGILSRSFVETFAGRIINVHPSLIPSFCGKGYYGLAVHQAVLDYGVKVTGATVHFVDEIPDGGAIIAQKAVDVLPSDTPQVLQRRVMEQAEWILLPRCIEQLCAGRKGDCMDLYRLLENNRYPGRGIVAGHGKDGRFVVAYFIMGRSPNSRNRVFVAQGDDLFTEPFDPSLVEDPSLIIYAPVRTLPSALVVSNGDQSDTIADFLKQGKSFSDALQTRCYEPDAPNYTPRISMEMDGVGYTLSILKRTGGECERLYYRYDDNRCGVGHLIHTYACDGNPLPSYEGEPKEVALEDDIDTFASRLWESLDGENRISLFVRYVDRSTGAYEQRIINKNTR
jgi:phosphoribosylglycinamide formyltransferase-1